MPGPILPSLKIRRKHELEQEIRDIYAGYQTKPIITVPRSMTTEELHQHASVDVTYKKYRGTDRKGHRYYYYKAFTQKKPGRGLILGFPAFMQRKHKWEK